MVYYNFFLPLKPYTFVHYIGFLWRDINYIYVYNINFLFIFCISFLFSWYQSIIIYGRPKEGTLSVLQINESLVLEAKRKCKQYCYCWMFAYGLRSSFIGQAFVGRNLCSIMELCPLNLEYCTPLDIYVMHT